MIPTFVIACDELLDRKEACRKHLLERGVEFTFWRGLHGKTWGLRTSLEYDPGKCISPGHVALNINHWTLWNHLFHQFPGWGAVYEGRDSFLVCEDDVVFPPDWKDKLAGVLTDLDAHMPDWEFVFVGLCDQEPQVWHKVTERIGPPTSKLCRLCDPFGTHAYLVRESALPKMIDRMREARRNMDQQLYRDVLKDNHVRWCAVLPTVIRQRTYDYESTGKPEWEPSCVDPECDPVIPPEPQRLHAHEARALAGHAGDPEPPVELIHLSLPVVDPYPCIYRGEGADVYARAASGRSVPAAECARLGGYCHTKVATVGAVLIDDGDSPVVVKSCDACSLRSEMMTPAFRPRLPIPDGHFNPSIASWGGRLILATRDSWGHSKIALWDLSNSEPDWGGVWKANHIGSFGSSHADAPRLEDPRLFLAPHPATDETHLHAMLNLPDGYPPKRVQVGYVRFTKDLSGIEFTQVYSSPRQNAYEKNWVPFYDHPGRDLRWVYAGKPHHIVIGSAETHTSPNPLPWVGGVYRGGASPVLQYENGEPVYFHFFHGCLKRSQGSVYTIGCSVFEGKPPFRVLRQTAKPLRWPDLPAVGEHVTKRYVLWPGGAVRHTDSWFIACGIDDSYSRIVRIPCAEVEATMTDQPETGGALGIRDTPLAKGVPAKEKM